MPTFAEALQSQQGADPLGSFLNGYKTGLAGAQARDVSARDQSRLAMEAVAQAERAKAQNFNQMLDRMKMAQDDRQFNDTLALKAEELKIRKDQFAQNLDFLNRGVNPRTGQSYGSTGIDTFIPEKFRVGGGAADSGSTTPDAAGYTPFVGDSSLAPLPANGETLAGMQGGTGGDLLPGDTFGAAPGSRADVNVVTDLPSGGSNMPALFDKAPASPDVPGAPTISPGTNTPMGEIPAVSVAPDTLESPAAPAAPAAPTSPAGQAAAATAAAPAAKPGTIGAALARMQSQFPEAYAKATPPTFAEAADKVLTSQRNLQDGLQSQLEASGASAQEAARFAQEAGSELRNKRLSPEHQGQLKAAQNKAASIFGEEKQKVISLAKKVEEEAKKTKLIEERADAMKSIDNLSTVLPIKDYHKLAEAAMTPRVDPQVTAALTDLQTYNAIREANGWTYQSKGIIPARKLTQAYAELTSPKASESRQASEEAALIKAELDNPKNAPEKKADRDDYLANLQKQYNTLLTQGLFYRSRLRDYEDAKKADIRIATPVAAPAAAPTVKPAGTAAPAAPAAAHPADKYF